MPYTKLRGSTKGQKAKVPLECKSVNICSWRGGGKIIARKETDKKVMQRNVFSTLSWVDESWI